MAKNFACYIDFKTSWKDSADKFSRIYINFFFSAYLMKAVQIGNSKMYELFLCSAYDEEGRRKIMRLCRCTKLCG